MKKDLNCLLVAFVLICSSLSFAQKEKDSLTAISKSNDSLKMELNQLHELVGEGSYTRIPNEDFENIIDNKIHQSIHETLQWWIFIVGVVVSLLTFLLGFLINKYAKTYLQTVLDTKMDQMNKQNEEKIKSINKNYISKVGNSLLEFQIELLVKSDHYIDKTKLDELKSYLTDEDLMISDYNKGRLIDAIMRGLYHSKFEDRIKEMITLIEEHEKKITLSEATYATAAIAFLNMYYDFGSNNFLDSALENCDKSIAKTPDYGLAFALKLELYSLAIIKSFDQEEQNHYERELLKVFKDIENNNSQYLCKELVDRLQVDNAYFGSGIEKLNKDYPEQMAKIRARIPVPEQNNKS